MTTPKYTSTFIFEVGPLDDDFHRLNDEIAERARRIPGFLGEEEWVNETTGIYSEVYYWRDMDALRQLIGMDTHQVAKRRHEEWIGRYRVVNAEVQSVYGDPTFGLELVGRDEVQGAWTDTAVGLDGNHAKIALLRTPDGHGQIELSSTCIRRRYRATRSSPTRLGCTGSRSRWTTSTLRLRPPPNTAATHWRRRDLSGRLPPHVPARPERHPHHARPAAHAAELDREHQRSDTVRSV